MGREEGEQAGVQAAVQVTLMQLELGNHRDGEVMGFRAKSGFHPRLGDHEQQA